MFPNEPFEDLREKQEEPGDTERLLQLNSWFIRMRWLACAVSAVLIVATVYVLEYLEKGTFAPLALLVACLLGANTLFRVCVARRWLVAQLREIQIGVDLVILTAMLHYSGGIENPVSFAYLFHVIIGGILLDRRKCFAIVVVASALLSALAFCEMTGVIDHYTLLIFPHPAEEHGLLHAAHEPLYVTSVVMLQVLLMSLTAYFTTSITGRLRSEEHRALAERQRLERVLQATGAGLLISDSDLRPVWLNEQIRDWLSVADGGAERAATLLAQWTGGKDGPAAKTLRDGAVRVVERELRDPEGNRHIFQVTVAPLTDNRGRVYQVAELAQDVTEHKLVEAELIHSGKMAVLGLMAAGIAHEVGNPLASISTRLQLLKEEHGEAFLHESIRLLQEQIARIGRIVHSVSQVARPGKNEWARCNVSEIVTEALSMLSLHRQSKRCEIRADTAAELPETMAVKDQLVQVVLNLGLNALEAMPDGGTLAIRTYRDGADICIELADTGVGMDEEVRAKLFEPFFTTKGSGLGLGLSIVHNIVDGHGGRIQVESQPGEGSTFTIRLPVRMPTGARRNETRDATP